MMTIGEAAQEFRRSLVIMAAFSLPANVLLLVAPLYLLQIYDRVLPSQSEETLLFLTLAAALALVVIGLLEVVRSIIATRTAARLDIMLSDQALRTIARHGSAGGSGAQPIRDVTTLRNLLSSKLAFGLLDLPFAAIFIALMYLVHPALFWITLSGALLLIAIAVMNQLASARSARRQTEQTLDDSWQAEHLARNADSIIAMGMLSDIVDHWGKSHASSLSAADAASRTNAWFAGLSRTSRLGLQIAILGYGAHLVLIGEMTAGMIFAASLIAARGLQPIDQIIGSWRQLAAGWQSWRRTSHFLQAAPRAIHTSMPAPSGLLEVEGLTQLDSCDPAGPPVLQGISFRVEAGETLAIAGPSGAGKSTLARMLVGAARPRSGHVRIDGHDISNWAPEELGRHIGYLAQEVELLPGTIAENISRFAPDAPDEAIIAAARHAHAENLIQRMPKGYDTRLGVGGMRPSGGERQRIALARAFYGELRMLVLDEPDASLDEVGQEALARALAHARSDGITAVIITQRQEVLAAADKIMRLKDGRIVDFAARDDALLNLRRRQGQELAGPATWQFAPQLRASVSHKS